VTSAPFLRNEATAHPKPYWKHSRRTPSFGALSDLENEPTDDDVVEIVPNEPSDHDRQQIAPNEPNAKFGRF
jgi:hypothetical protein